MAAIVAVMSPATRWGTLRYGDAGIAVVLAITGAMDVDAAIITMHGLPGGALDARVAGLILATPILLNTLVKAGISIALGGWTRGSRAALPLFASVATSVVALHVVVSVGHAYLFDVVGLCQPNGRCSLRYASEPTDKVRS